MKTKHHRQKTDGCPRCAVVAGSTLTARVRSAAEIEDSTFVRTIKCRSGENKFSAECRLATGMIDKSFEERGVSINRSIDAVAYGLDASLKLLDSLDRTSKLVLQVFDSLGVRHKCEGSSSNVIDEPRSPRERTEP